MLRLWIICLAIGFCVSEANILNRSDDLKVCTPYIGCVRGKYMPGYDTEKFQAFLGIPFARPPVNELRFQSPKAPPKFVGVYNATEIKPDCIQKNYLILDRSVNGVEDCLYLNVYRPITNSSGLLPVMVYIFGGGWFEGTPSPLVHGPEFFMDTREVILVLMNYRLGPIGFMSTNDVNMPGNLGLKDQLLALKWVKKNILYFGGNSTQTTVFGESAGSSSAHILSLSKQSKGQFRNLIAMSGTANIPFAIASDPLGQVRDMAKYCNISNAENLSTAELANELRKIDASTIVDLTDKLKVWDVDPLAVFRPIVESKDIKDAIITEDPMEIMRKGDYKPIPWMAGFMQNEGGVRAVSLLENDELVAEFNSNFDDILAKIMMLPKSLTQSQINTTIQRLVDEYFDGQHSINSENEFGYMDVFGDRSFKVPLYNAIDAYVNVIKTKKYPVHLYKFSYKGANTYPTVFNGGPTKRDFGAIHCDDLVYTFHSPGLWEDFPRNSTDAAVSRAIVANFVHFAKHNEPLNADQQLPCNKENFEKNGFCDYQEYKNTEDGYFEIATSNIFRPSQTKLWNEILPGDAAN